VALESQIAGSERLEECSPAVVVCAAIMRERFAEFAKRYRTELRRGEAKTVVEEVLEMLQRRPVTLPTATHDVEHSGAAVVAADLDELATKRFRGG
jgi:uncharacterized protein YeaO (DUF488 family)